MLGDVGRGVQGTKNRVQHRRAGITKGAAAVLVVGEQHGGLVVGEQHGAFAIPSSANIETQRLEKRGETLRIGPTAIIMYGVGVSLLPPAVRQKEQ